MQHRNLPPGRIVSRRGRGVRLGGSKPVGLTVRQGMLEGTVLDECDVWVRPLTAVKHGENVSYDPRTGKLNPARGGVPVRGARYLTSTQAGKQFSLLRLRLDDAEQGSEAMASSRKTSRQVMRQRD